MPKTKKKRLGLFEQVAGLPVKANRDVKHVAEMLDQGIVEDVKLQGLVSINGRVYLSEGMDPRTYAVTPYGAKMPCHLNHPHFDPNNQAEVRRAITKSRPVESVFGVFEEPYKTGDGMCAKRLRFNTDHPFAKTFRKWVLESPDSIGFSPAQFVDSYHDGEKEVVERVVGVYSIDLVGQGATTHGVFEAMGYGGKCEAMEEEEGEANAVVEDDEVGGVTPEGDTIDDLLEDDDDLADEPVDDEGADEGADGNGPDITEEMLSALTKVIQSKLAGEIDDKAAIKKIKHLFATHSAVSEAVMATIETDPAKFLRTHGDKAVRTAGRAVLAENVSLKRGKAQDEKRSKVVALVEARNFDPEVVKEIGLVEELMDCKDEAAMNRRIATFAKIPGLVKKAGRPKSAHQLPAKAITEGADDTAPEFDEKAAEERMAKMANAVVGAAELN